MQAKEKLVNLVGKRIMTTMIGSISVVEKTFGLVWNKDGNYYDILDDDGKRKDKLTEVEEDFLDRFEEVREKILNYGNNQKRGAIHEIAEYYEVEPKIYHTTFAVKE